MTFLLLITLELRWPTNNTKYQGVRGVENTYTIQLQLTSHAYCNEIVSLYCCSSLYE